MTLRRYGLAAPALLAAYGILRMSGDAQSPGTVWAVGHLLLLGSLALFVPAVLDLRRQASAATAATAAAVIAVLGLAAGMAQAAIDLVVGLRATDQADMDTLFLAVKAHPAVTPAVYTVGPLLFYVGLLALLVVRSAGRSAGRPVGAARWLVPLLALAGTAAMAVGLDLLVVGALCYGIALAWAPRTAPACA
ncbi:hypothetical protein ACGFW5_08975 [Streptomyces sp. NPDC048416]|uniref:hypothetical protein n=1 Tax=Streptomyces sp. NPDC048416 TaxID=3365546 RepID=UPI00372346D2